MIRGLYSCANGLLAESARNDTIAGNLAGLSVTGFRRDFSTVRAFNRALDYASGGEAAGLVGPSALLAASGSVDLQPGPVRATGNQFDLALEGAGYFCVQTANGEAYTRAGAFRIDSSRRLITSAGDPVLGASGPVFISGSKMQVMENGDVIADGARIDRLKLVSFPPGAQAVKIGSGLLRLASGSPQAMPGASTRVRQGYLEEANVNAVTELVAMIASLRSFEASQRALQANDETLDKAINEVGRV